MVAELAREDWEDLRAEGLNPTLDDFDRLNLLALRLECGAETTPANHPRIGWAGDVAFYEPTAAALVWYNDFGARLDGDDARQAAFYFALAHAREPEAFAGLESPRAIRRAVKGWMRGVPCTVAEMARACHYAAWGYDDAVAAETEQRKSAKRRRGTPESAANLERLERVVASVAALGMPYSELMVQTPSRLNAMVLAAQVDAGAAIKPDVCRMQAQYSATLAEIRRRLEATKAEAQGGREG